MFPVFAATDTPGPVAVWCWHIREGVWTELLEASSYGMFDTCVPKTGCLQAKLETWTEGRDSGVAAVAV